MAQLTRGMQYFPRLKVQRARRLRFHAPVAWEVTLSLLTLAGYYLK